MGQMITKPDANPIIFAVCNWFGAGALGYFLMGQKKKAMIAVGVFVAVMFLSVCTLGLASMMYVYVLIFAYDAYLLGQKLQSGQAIGENENGLEFLNVIFKD